jgi:cell division protein FtsI/penicillin-binding protein 2
MTNVIEQSINTGAVFMQQQSGMEAFARYLEKFGFGAKTGIDAPGEVKGSIANLKNNREIEYATASFGQGISATPIGMLQSLSAIANKGNIMRPHLIARTVDADGVIAEIAPQILAPQVVSEETALTVSRMMASTVKNTYLNAKMSVDGYTISAKTGTAQIPNPNGGGYLGPDQTIQSIVSFFPSYDPRYILFFKMDRPKGSDAAGNSLPTYVKNMIVFLIQYAQIPPDRMPETIKTP